MKCNIKTDNDLFQKYKLSLSDEPVTFKQGKAHICVMNYNTKPVSIKSGAAIGYFNKLNDQDDFEWDYESTPKSVDDLESISSENMSDCDSIDYEQCKDVEDIESDSDWSEQHLLSNL